MKPKEKAMESEIFWLSQYKNYPEKYKEMKRSLKITNKDVAKITGNTERSISELTRPSGNFPRNLRLAIWVWEKLTK